MQLITASLTYLIDNFFWRTIFKFICTISFLRAFNLFGFLSCSLFRVRFLRDSVATDWWFYFSFDIWYKRFKIIVFFFTLEDGWFSFAFVYLSRDVVVCFVTPLFIHHMHRATRIRLLDDLAYIENIDFGGRCNAFPPKLYIGFLHSTICIVASRRCTSQISYNFLS